MAIGAVLERQVARLVVDVKRRLIGVALDLGFRRLETLKAVRWGIRSNG
jgi:hypothetical protein